MYDIQNVNKIKQVSSKKLSKILSSVFFLLPCRVIHALRMINPTTFLPADTYLFPSISFPSCPRSPQIRCYYPCFILFGFTYICPHI